MEQINLLAVVGISYRGGVFFVVCLYTPYRLLRGVGVQGVKCLPSPSWQDYPQVECFLVTGGSAKKALH